MPKAADPAALPKIKLTDNLYDIRAAFEEVQRQVGRSSGFCGASLRALWRTPLMLWSCAWHLWGTHMQLLLCHYEQGSVASCLLPILYLLRRRPARAAAAAMARGAAAARVAVDKRCHCCTAAAVLQFSQFF